MDMETYKSLEETYHEIVSRGMQSLEDTIPRGEDLEQAKALHRRMLDEYPPSKYPLPWSRFKKGE